MNYYDDDKLELEEWQIMSIDDDDYNYGQDNKTKRTIISAGALGCEFPMYENDMNLLKTILDCDSEEDIVGRNIIAVCKDNLIKAIGNQGLYIPLYYKDNSSRILPEDELCELLDCYKVARYNKKGEVITYYEVPRKNTITYGSYKLSR